MNEINNTLERFKKHFKKGDLVFVGFYDNKSTYGSIQGFDEEGFELVQPHTNHKAVKYSWNHFEILAHDGYMINKYGMSKSEYFVILKDSYAEECVSKEKETVLEQIRILSNKRLTDLSSVDKRYHAEQEVKKLQKEYTDPIGYLGGEKREIRKPKIKQDCVIIGTHDGVNCFPVPLLDYKVSYQAKKIVVKGNIKVQIFPSAYHSVFEVHGSDGFTYDVILSNKWFANKVDRQYSYSLKEIKNKEMIDNLLSGKETFQIYTGDPWPLFGRRIDKQTWKHENGACAFVPNHRVLMVGKIR